MKKAIQKRSYQLLTRIILVHFDIVLLLQMLEKILLAAFIEITNPADQIGKHFRRQVLQLHPFAFRQKVFGLLHVTNDRRFRGQLHVVGSLVMLRNEQMTVAHFAANVAVAGHRRRGADNLLVGHVDYVFRDFELLRRGRQRRGRRRRG